MVTLEEVKNAVDPWCPQVNGSKEAIEEKPGVLRMLNGDAGFIFPVTLSDFHKTCHLPTNLRFTSPPK
jgi:hypothetical protein